MDIAVIGAGYVGLVTGVGLAELGHRVRISERDPGRLAKLRAATAPFYEPGLDDLLAERSASGALTFHDDNRRAVDGAELIFIAVPTPMSETGAADLTIVEAVIEEIAGVVRPDAVIAIKSTVPPGSARRFQKLLRDLGAQASVVSNPEFLQQGNAVNHFLHPERILIGTDDQAAAAVMERAYEGIDPKKHPKLVMDPTSAELVKYGANSFLAARVSFVNSLANLAEALGADIDRVVDGMGRDTRIGNRFFQPGPGYGGSCLPKDTNALLHTAREAGYGFAMLEAIIEVNERQLERMVDKVGSAVGDLSGARVAVWGLTFKAGTSDVRDSPAVDLVEALRSAGAITVCYDPMADPEAVERLGLERVDDPIEAAHDADVVLIATEWKTLRDVDLNEVRRAMRGDAIVDTRNLLDPVAVRQLGFRYFGVGRPSG